MGTQQILLIVLSVIIVGVAIAVGISMFNNQAYNSNKAAIASDAQTFASQVVQFFKTPVSQGGAGGELTNLVQTNIEGFIGFTDTVGAGVGIDNENGTYVISGIDTTAGTVEITGTGKAEKGGLNPQIVTTITFPAGTIGAVASDV